MAQNSVYSQQGTSGGNFVLMAHVRVQLFLAILSLLTLFQRFDVAAGEGDADAVNGDLSLNGCLTSVLESLRGRKQRIKSVDSTMTGFHVSMGVQQC